MTDHQGSAMDVVAMLRERFGVRYEASHDAGRREIIDAIGDRTGIGSGDAESMFRQMIDGGQIRYVPGHEVDPVADHEAQHDERSDGDNRGTADDSDSLRINAIPGQGGPGAATSGVGGPPVGAIAAGGTTGIPSAAPLAIGSNTGAETGDLQGGYWDFGGGGAGGVVPSSTRKGQVEPRGT